MSFATWWDEHRWSGTITVDTRSVQFLNVEQRPRLHVSNEFGCLWQLPGHSKGLGGQEGDAWVAASSDIGDVVWLARRKCKRVLSHCDAIVVAMFFCMLPRHLFLSADPCGRPTDIFPDHERCRQRCDSIFQ